MAELDLADIYARHRQGLFTHALSITGRVELAEDAVHEAFARLCRKSRSTVIDPVAYVFAAVRLASIDQRRRRKIEIRADEMESIFAATGAPPERRAIDAERAVEVAAAIEALPVDHREAIVLRIYGGLSFAQIAEVTGEPLPTVASRYRRSLEKLRERLEKVV